jgi:acyl-[acyl-carrier-protein]-phospholipid O-acyltransferase/long-chain-fatty-acid--[acyl-carrier-protein] ligase
MFSGLMRSRRFAPLFWCQFLSAFNDNCVRQMLAMLILFDIGQKAAGSLITLAVGIFILPSLLLSAFGGELADAHDKARIARALKAAEIFVQAIAAAGFVLHSIILLYVALFGLGTIAALFGPIKYGILPDHLETAELPAGNALIEGATFLAILFGLIAGGTIVAHAGSPPLVATQLMVVALACWATSRFIPATGVAAPDLKIRRNVLASTVGLLRELRADRRLWSGGIAVSWFWMTGAVALALVPVIVRTRIGGDIGVETAITALFAVGVGCGSILSAVIARGRILLLPVPTAAFFIAIFLIDLGRVTMYLPAAQADVGVAAFLSTGMGQRIALDVVATAIAGALLVVPAFSAVQAWAREERRARVVAAVNILSALFMAAGSLVTAILQARPLTVSEPALLLALGALNIGAGIYFLLALPGRFIADGISLVLRLCCRLDVNGAEHLSKTGGRALLGVSHRSRLDALVLFALLPEKPLFIVDETVMTRWWVKPFRDLCLVLPPGEPASLRRLVSAVGSGRRAVIFLDDRLTATHQLPSAYRLAAVVARRSHAQIIGARLDGLEQKPFALRPATMARCRIFPKVHVTFGAPKPATAAADVYKAMTDLAFAATPLDRTLIEALADVERRVGSSMAIIEDPFTGALTMRRFLIAAAVLARKVMAFSEPEESIGLLLPNANATLAAFFGVEAAGRVPAMLNYTAGGANLRAACAAARVRSVLTSRAFLDKADLHALAAEIAGNAEILYLEDVRASVTWLDKLRGLWEAGRQIHPRKADDPAAVLFTSGSEGAPKGVVLTHRNMIANVAQVVTQFDVDWRDIAFNALPVFHTFGLTSCTLLPMLAGVKVFLYPSPLHYRQIPELIHKSGATFLFGTDTFLKHYGRIADADMFRSLRYVVAGGEPITAETRKLYKEKCGVTVLEGYGITEAAPVIAVNTPISHRDGTVGKIVPCLEARLDKIEGIAEGGRLFVRGPNVMRGYYRADNPGVIEETPQGWHDTGDVVAIDADGFVTVRGRVKRFAKIGGEMVSLTAVESICEGLWPEDSFVIASVPDTRKGERLVMVTTKADAGRGELLAWMKERGAAELSIPAEILIVETLPRLGSGKIDYVELNRLVRAKRGVVTVG